MHVAVNISWVRYALKGLNLYFLVSCTALKCFQGHVLHLLAYTQVLRLCLTREHHN